MQPKINKLIHFSMFHVDFVFETALLIFGGFSHYYLQGF